MMKSRGQIINPYVDRTRCKKRASNYGQVSWFRLTAGIKPTKDMS